MDRSAHTTPPEHHATRGITAMTKAFSIQIGGKTYTRDNLHELNDDPNVRHAERSSTTNVVFGEMNGIQAGEIHGGLTFDR